MPSRNEAISVWLDAIYAFMLGKTKEVVREAFAECLQSLTQGVPQITAILQRDSRNAAHLRQH